MTFYASVADASVPAPPTMYTVPIKPAFDGSQTSSVKALLRRYALIGDPGNFSDYRTGKGCVQYVFELAEHEITNAEYSEFLNAVATDSDPHGLYVPDMNTGIGGGISRAGSAGAFTYAPKLGFERRPVAYLSWFSLARYANWLHFNRPLGHQVVGVTEGDSVSGAYDTSRFSEFSKRIPKTVKVDMFRRNLGARFFIPSDDEWYKAAYFDPLRAGLRKYWNYPNRSDQPPANKVEVTSASNYQAATMGESAPFYLGEVGAFKAKGYYPVFDLGGNLWEWTEDWRSSGTGKCWRCNIPTKGLRGGSFNYIETGMRYDNIDPGYPSDHYFVYGGRLARMVEGKGSGSGWCAPSQVHSFIAWLTWRGVLCILIAVSLAALTGSYLAFRKRSHRKPD